MISLPEQIRQFYLAISLLINKSYLKTKQNKTRIACVSEDNDRKIICHL